MAQLSDCLKIILNLY